MSALLKERRSFYILGRVYDWMGGKSIGFAAFFAVCGTLLAFFQKLDLSYPALVTAILPFVVARSIAQDRYPPITAAQSVVVPAEDKKADIKVEITKEATEG